MFPVYNSTITNADVNEQISSLLDEIALGNWTIVLYNDDVNTFDWVVSCLVKYCQHDAIQAEQCAWFVHTKGKYAVKSGQKSRLAPICETLCEKGLSAVLEFKD
jgi:ATP-dependent Clp protease adaptor protein ClpS